MSFGTQIVYGGIPLRNVLIRNFDQTIQHEESGSDPIYSKFMISIESLVHQDDASVVLGVRGANAVDALAALQTHLQHPRQLFNMSFEGKVWLDVGSGINIRRDNPTLPDPNQDSVFIGGTDCNNGPKVHGLSVTHVSGYRSFRVTCTFEICVIICANFDRTLKTIKDPAKNADRYIVQHWLVNNRWSLEESQDAEMHWHRTIRGKCRVAHSALWTPSVRYLVTPRLSPKYRFLGSNYVLNRDGLSMDYSHSSKQEHAAPPPPCVDWHATQSEQVEAGGGKILSQFNMRLVGRPETSKKEIMLAGLAVIEARYGYNPIKINDKDGGTHSFYVLQANITDIVSANELHFSLTVMRAPDARSPEQQNSFWVGITWEMIEKWPNWPGGRAPNGTGTLLKNYDRKKWPEPIPWDDTGPASLFQNLFQSPCGGIPSAMIAPIETKPEAKQEIPDYRTKNPDPKPKLYRDNYGDGIPQTKQSSDSRINRYAHEAIYVNAEIESRILTDYGRVALPYFPKAAGSSGKKKQPSCKIVQHSQPTTKRCIWYRATRVGNTPRIPQILENFVDEAGIDHWLDELEFVPGTPQLLPDGLNFSFKMEMRLTYLLDRFIEPDDKHQVGTLPWDSLLKSDTLLHLSEIQTDKII